ncbi:substrate-binding periplasmic protein [Paraglaciecola sp.]|uniref:substrate-binding periplasmic protein n=1 Tax=Paraglaciecola sp. TaxID=1920173 RepID=UPI003EF71D80
MPRIVNANTITLNDIDWPPYLFPEQNSQYVGIGKEVLNTCLAETNYQMTYVPLPIKRTPLYMKNGRLDVSIFSYKKERETFLSYGKVPIFRTEYGFAVRADSDIKVNSLDDLAPHVIGLLAGLSYTPELMAIIEKKRQLGEVTDGYSINSMFAQMLSRNPRFDIMADSKDTFYWRAKTLGLSEKIEVLEYTIAYKEYFVTVSNSSKNIDNIPKFLTNMDSCITQLHQTGEYQKILDNYRVVKAAE